MLFIIYPFRYLFLKNDKRRSIIWRDSIFCLFGTAVIIALYLSSTGANFFAKDGFVDKIGSISSSLTGFYIAGLLAVATFSMPKADLDNVIVNGKVFLRSDYQQSNPLTRREYVCLMFGYLAMLALLMSIITAVESGSYIVIRNLLEDREIRLFKTGADAIPLVRFLGMSIFSMMVMHLVVTTGYGLYYLISKIYDREPELIQPPAQSAVRVP